MEQLTKWDFPDTIMINDGYEMVTVPDLTRENFNILFDKVNELIEVVNELNERGGSQ